MTDEPRARRTDPDTSHAAAASVHQPQTQRDRVLQLLEDAHTEGLDGITHQELKDRYKTAMKDRGWPDAAGGGIRTRCRELANQGKVRQVKDRRGTTAFGRESLLWAYIPEEDRVTPVDPQLTLDLEGL